MINPHEPPSVEMAVSFDIICANNRRSFEAEQVDNYFMWFYHPSRNTTPGQVDDRPGLTGIEYIGQYYGG